MAGWSNRKTYLGLKQSLTEFFRAPIRYLKLSNVVESQFEKPYLGEADYRKMHLDMPWPKFDPIGGGGAIEGSYIPWHIDFRCEAECWEAGEDFKLECTKPVLDALVMTGADDFSIAGITGQTVTIKAEDNADASPIINVLMWDPDKQFHGKVETVEVWPMPKPIPIQEYVVGPTQKVTGRHDGIMPSACATCNCETLTWDEGTSAETVAREDSCTVAITDSTGECGAYNWSVSGTGFTLDNASTTGLSNTLNADASACGTATITVTGCDGSTQATGYVRCTTGSWSYQSEINRSYCKNTAGSPSAVTVIDGEYKYICYEGWSQTFCKDSTCQTCDGYDCLGVTNSCGHTCYASAPCYYAYPPDNYSIQLSTTAPKDLIYKWVC